MGIFLNAYLIVLSDGLLTWLIIVSMHAYVPMVWLQVVRWFWPRILMTDAPSLICVGSSSVQDYNLTATPVVSQEMPKNCERKDRIRAIFLGFL